MKPLRKLLDNLKPKFTKGGSLEKYFPIYDVFENLFYQLHIWLYVIAIFGSLLKIQPFDQPNVEQTKINTQKLLIEKHK